MLIAKNVNKRYQDLLRKTDRSDFSESVSPRQTVDNVIINK